LFDRCREVQADPDDHLDLWARDHRKSTIITYGKTIQDILCSHGEGRITERELTFGIFSHTRPIAKSFMRQIKRELENNEVLKETFDDILYENPSAQSLKWSEDDGIIVKREGNPKEATVEAWGVVDGQPIGKHFDVLIYDDVVTRASVNTPEMIANTTEALELSYNLGTEHTKRRFIGTRYHFNDSYNTIMKRKTAIPRIYPATDDGTVEGKAVMLSQESLNNKRRDMGPYTFATQMLQNPKADETQGFLTEWLRYAPRREPTGLNVYLLFDPASGKKKGNDYTAAWAVGLGSDKNIYVLDMVRDRLNLQQRAELVMRWHRKYKPKQVRYEKYSMQADIEYIKTLQGAENYRFEIEEVGSSVSKNDRIRRLIPYFANKQIYLPEFLYYTDYEGTMRELVSEFVEFEYKAFPVSEHDDMMDALARLMEPDLSLIWPKEKQDSPINLGREREDSIYDM